MERDHLLAEQHLQLQRHRALRGHLLESGRQRRGRLRRAQLRLHPRLHRRGLHRRRPRERRPHRQHPRAQRHPGQRLGPPHQQAGQHDRDDVQRAPAGGRHVHLRRRRHRASLLRQPEPVHRQGRRFPQPAHLRHLPLLQQRRHQMLDALPHRGLQPAAQPRRHAGPGRGRVHLGRRAGTAADLHAEPGGQPGLGHRVDLTGVGRQRWQQLSLPLQVQPAVLHPRRGLVTRRPDGLHRHHRRAPVQLERPVPADRDLRRDGRLPRHADIGHARVGQLHRVRLALLRRRRPQRRVCRRASALDEQPERLQRRRPRRHPLVRPTGPKPANGAPLLGGNGNGRYSMSRANGDDMLLTGAGLWIASSNRFALDQCGHKTGHAGICLLPYK